MTRKNYDCIVIECSHLWPVSAQQIHSFLRNGAKIHILEPFYSFSHSRAPRLNFPPDMPPFLQKLVSQKKVGFIRAKDIGSQDFYWQGLLLAQQLHEHVYPEFNKAHSRLINFAMNVIGQDIEDAYRKKCGEMLELYASTALLAQRLATLFSEKLLLLTALPDHQWSPMHKLVKNSNAALLFPDRVTVQASTRRSDQKDGISNWCRRLGRIGLNALRSLQPTPEWKSGVKKGAYFIAVNLHAARRQLRTRQLGANFLVDEHTIRAEDIIYIRPLTPLSRTQEKRLNELGSDSIVLPSLKHMRSSLKLWLRFFYVALLSRTKEHDILHLTLALIQEKLIWGTVTEHLKIRHFITHADFLPQTMARNHELHEKGVRTWYFQDSNNQLYCSITEGVHVCEFNMQYMAYSDFVVWNRLAAEFIRRSHCKGSIHEVGCLRASSLYTLEQALQEISCEVAKLVTALEPVTAFDSSYGRNSINDEEEGLAFARHLLQLLNSFPEICIIIKNKKEKDFYTTYHPDIEACYEELNRHPRAIRVDNTVSPDVLIALSLFTLSFPFTSTTYEALSSGHPAIWHDPMGTHRITPFAKYPGLLTHNFEELKEYTRVRLAQRKDKFVPPFPAGAPEFDVSCDGNALQRFRHLLINGEQ